MIPTGPVPVRPLPRRKGPMGRWQVLLPDGRWMPEADAIAAGIPLAEPLPTLAPSPVVVRHEAPESEAPPPAVARVAPSAQSLTIGHAGGSDSPSVGSEPRGTRQSPPVEADGAAVTSYRAGDGPPQSGTAGATRRPTGPASGPTIPCHEAPEVPTMPAAVAPSKPPARGPGAPPSPAQEQAWKAVTERGLYWPDVAREMGTTSWSVKSMIQAYMRRNGIPGEPPGRTPKDETTRRSAVAHGQTPKGSTPARANGRETQADAFAGAPSEPLVLAPEGHPWAADPDPIDETLAVPTSDQHLDPDGGHTMTAPVVRTGTDHSQAMHLHASTGGEPEPVALPAKGTPAPHRPRTGGGGRGDPDDFLGRLEHELDALAREDADLVARARELVEARTAVAARIERLRTAGEVYRAVMAGRAA